MRKELRSVVRVSKHMALVSEAPTALIPSVSSMTVVKSWHSGTVVSHPDTSSAGLHAVAQLEGSRAA